MELRNLITKAKEADDKINAHNQDIITAKEAVTSAEKQLDAYEVRRFELSEKMLGLRDKISEIESKMSEGELRRLKEKTQSYEDKIKKIETKITFKNNEITSQKNVIDFQNIVINDNLTKIEQMKNDNIQLEQDKIRFAEEKSVFEYHNNTYICPFCGNEMKWENRLFCNCKTQVEYFKKKQDIERQINSLNNALKNLKSIYIKDTYSFFAKHFLSQIDTMIDNLKKDRDDVENLIKEEEKWQKQSK